MKKIFITGGSGFLAVNWIIKMRDKFSIINCQNNKIVNIKGSKNFLINLFDIDEVEKFIINHKPDLIIHCASITNIEKCENQKKLANETHVLITKNLSQISKKYNIKLVYISTDHIYDGKKSFYSEKDIPSPLNYYAETKLIGESEVLDASNKNLVIRTNFFGWTTSYQRNFASNIINLLLKNKKVDVFSDVYFTPVFISDLINITHNLIEHSADGIFNISSNERLSKLDFAIKLAKKFKLKYNLINGNKKINVKGLINRPNDMSLDNKKLKKFLNIEIPSIDLFINKFYETYDSKMFNEISKIK